MTAKAPTSTTAKSPAGKASVNKTTTAKSTVKPTSTINRTKPRPVEPALAGGAKL
jgi:hypothetical protein